MCKESAYPFTMVATRLLRWIYLARLALVTGVFLAALRVWTDPELPPDATLLATLLLVTALGFTAFSFWYSHVAAREPGRTFLYAQVVFDVLAVTAVVHLTGGGASELAPLYVLVIAEGALLLPMPGGFLTGALSVLLYFAVAAWGGHLSALLGGVAAERTLGPEVLTRMAIFGVIAVVTAFLGERVQRTGTRLGAVESELRRLRLETSDILGALETGVVTLTPRGELVYANPAAQALLDLRAEESLGRPVLDALDEAAPGIADVVDRTLRTGRPIRRYETHTRATPELRVLGLRSALLERDTEPWITLVMQDITAGKRAEAADRRADRLGAVAELAASLAHEIKNPLASIRSAVEQLTRDGARLGRDDRGLLGNLVLTESDRLSRLLSGFIEFSGVSLRDTRVVDLGTVAREAVEVARRHPDAGRRARIEVDAPAPVDVEGDADLIHRIVFNLVLNALQHSPEGSRIRVEVEAVDDARVPPDARYLRAGMLRVIDQGPGIPADQIERVLDPFFTTRDGGSGLGLAVVHRAVEAHEGYIFIDAAEGGGTVFTVFLPARLP
jgi:two-component system, NtrC family, sensor histidine kinase PilS